jgi:Domain of unknown function (DUF397)
MNWTKSSYSSAQGNCVEVASQRDGVAVRDSKDKAGPVLLFSAGAWQAFVNDIKAGSTGTVED